MPPAGAATAGSASSIDGRLGSSSSSSRSGSSTGSMLALGSSDVMGAENRDSPRQEPVVIPGRAKRGALRAVPNDGPGRSLRVVKNDPERLALPAAQPADAVAHV